MRKMSEESELNDDDKLREIVANSTRRLVYEEESEVPEHVVKSNQAK